MTIKGMLTGEQRQTVINAYRKYGLEFIAIHYIPELDNWSVRFKEMDTGVQRYTPATYFGELKEQVAFNVALHILCILSHPPMIAGCTDELEDAYKRFVIRQQ